MWTKMNGNLRVAAVFAIMLTLALILSACGADDPTPTPTSAPAPPADVVVASPALVAAAQAEGELNFLGSSIDNPAAWAAWESGMNAMFGINVKLNFTSGPSFSKMARRLIEESAAGQKPSTDLFIGSEGSIVDMWETDNLLEVNWAELSDIVPNFAIQLDGHTVIVDSKVEPAIIYNTDVVPPSEAPTTFEDLADPKWEGMIAGTTYAAYWDTAASILPDGDAYMTELMGRITEKNLVSLDGCGGVARVATGEFPIFAIDCGGAPFRDMKAKGAPVGRNFLGANLVTLHEYLGVPKGSEHPNMAKLFIIYLQTPEAQGVMWKEQYKDSAWVKGSETAKLITTLRGEGKTVVHHSADRENEESERLQNLRGTFRKLMAGG